MKIAQIAPLYEAVPPKLYGGTERIVAYLCDALVELGHDVTLFASADSKTCARLVPMRDEAIRLDAAPLKCDVAAHLSMLRKVQRLADGFDVLHFHIDLLHFPFFEEIADRTVTTLHGRLDLKDLDPTYGDWRAYPLVSVSDNQRKPLPGANWVGTVHHGLPTTLLKPPLNPSGDYLAFLGRIAPDKGPDRAIDIARRARMPLRIAAKVDKTDEAYFREKIGPLLSDPLIEFVGEISDAEKADFLGNARALLFPVDWPEPFGLVMIEAMAVGVPVIATACGSVPEILDNGKTGVLVHSTEEAVAAVEHVGSFDRRTIRRVFERRFSSRIMARKYLPIYRRAVAYRPGSPLGIPSPSGIPAVAVGQFSEDPVGTPLD